jgi:hypothetical protein
MSLNKLINPGFGIGTAFGTPTTVAVDATSTVAITGSAYVTGQYHMSANVGVNLTAVSTSNGVTGTYTILRGSGGVFLNDNASWTLVNTTTSVNVVLIGAP